MLGLMKQLLTKYQIFTKLPKIHIFISLELLDQLLLPGTVIFICTHKKYVKVVNIYLSVLFELIKINLY